MNKYEIKYMLEQAMSSVDRLTDTTGKQSLHIENIWAEIKDRDSTIELYKSKLIEKNEEIIRLRNLIKSQSDKNLTEHHFPTEVNN
jgi:hypothetical protein|tara:strand:+ start:2353 stop:2610 length:258 start_codon:yes stop_codon:yes gene_type:complete